MKKVILMLTIASVFASCNNQTATETSAAAEVSKDSTGTNYVVDSAASVMTWAATKKVGAHNGTINVSGGNLNIKDGNIVSGAFTINMNTIKNVDLTDSVYNGKLVGHLMSPDFFNVAAFPTGKFEVTASEVLTNDAAGNTHKVSGNLTIKDSVHNISFPVKVVVEGDNVTTTGEVVINRLQWGMVYGHVDATTPATIAKKIGDSAINDEVKIGITLKAKKG
jgi:polyisoprenoid-binding protein YceI